MILITPMPASDQRSALEQIQARITEVFAIDGMMPCYTMKTYPSGQPYMLISLTNGRVQHGEAEAAGLILDHQDSSLMGNALYTITLDGPTGYYESTGVEAEHGGWENLTEEQLLGTLAEYAQHFAESYDALGSWLSEGAFDTWMRQAESAAAAALDSDY